MAALASDSDSKLQLEQGIGCDSNKSVNTKILLPEVVVVLHLCSSDMSPQSSSPSHTNRSGIHLSVEHLNS